MNIVFEGRFRGVRFRRRRDCLRRWVSYFLLLGRVGGGGLGVGGLFLEFCGGRGNGVG